MSQLFVHRELLDEVGVGKTLSMATGALVSALLNDGPVLILALSTLTIQWQIEMMDKLGIPTAVWSSQKKVRLGVEGQILSLRGDASSINKCPYRIAIVSTGLVMHQHEEGCFIKEAGLLLKNKFGTVILDEAHKARARGGLSSRDGARARNRPDGEAFSGLGEKAAEPNNLLSFMLIIAKRTRHLILGTATPIQTNVRELWDLLRNPLPPANEHDVISRIRDSLAIQPSDFYCAHAYDDLEYLVKEMWLPECSSDGFFRQKSPVLRHVVLRKRKQLEDAGLLDRVGVNTHPMRGSQALYQSRFVGLGIRTNAPFEVAYEKAEEFSRLLYKRTPSAGFMKTLMLQRICSSFASGLNTARRMMQHTISNEDEDTVYSLNIFYRT